MKHLVVIHALWNADANFAYSAPLSFVYNTVKIAYGIMGQTDRWTVKQRDRRDM